LLDVKFRHNTQNTNHVDGLNNKDIYNQWIDYFEEKIDDEYKSRDSNILLSNVNPSSGLNGLGELPCFCRNRSTVSMTFNTGSLAWISYEKFEKDMYNTDIVPFSFRQLITVIHEIGHNVGLKHNMGYAWYDDHHDVIKSTPMLAEYVRDEKYSGKKNYFGDKIVDYNEYEGTNVEIVPHFNSDISLSEIVYEQSILQ